MNCVVINGTEVRACTYRLKEIFLDELKPEELLEFYLPKDAPGYCIGCKLCFELGEECCPHYETVKPIWTAMTEADLIVFAYPVYCMRAPGHVKALLDHFGVHWFAHRPEPKMFSKTAAIITQSIGAPNGPAQKDVKTSLEWLGVASVKPIGFGMKEGVIWEDISEERRNHFESKIRSFARGFKDLRPQKRSLKSKIYFSLCKKIQKNLRGKLKEGEKPSTDLQYWMNQGWV